MKPRFDLATKGDDKDKTYLTVRTFLCSFRANVAHDDMTTWDELDVALYIITEKA